MSVCICNRTHTLLIPPSVIESTYREEILPDLFPLRKAIAKLQDASFKLDEEKVSAEKAFLEAMKKIGRVRDPRILRRIIQWIKEHLGIGAQEVQDLKFGAFKWMSSITESRSSEMDIWKSHGKGPIYDFIRAAKRVRVANQKLVAFERGFLSEDGIKDREWYKHLGVAPGKHLGKFLRSTRLRTPANVFKQGMRQRHCQA